MREIFSYINNYELVSAELWNYARRYIPNGVDNDV